MRTKCPRCHGRIRTDMFGTVCCEEETRCGWYDRRTLPAQEQPATEGDGGPLPEGISAP